MRRKKQPFLETGEMLTIEGTCLSADGKFKAHGLLPGEVATFVPIKRQKGVWVCRAEAIENPHLDRVEPKCAHAQTCGGCSFQHYARPAQLSFKSAWLRSLFEDCQPEQWLEKISGPAYGYRTKARLGVKYVAKKDRTLVGFREVGSAFIAEMSSCDILVPALSVLIAPLAGLINGLDARSSIPQVEVAASDDEVALVIRHLDALSLSDLAALTAFEAEFQVHVLLQSGGPDTVTALNEGPAPTLRYRLSDQGLVYLFHPMAFTQVNQDVNQKMVNLALELLALEAGDRVLDAFCGIGNFSLPIARKTFEVLGLESSQESVEQARKNARLNNIVNAQFEAENLYEIDAAKDLLQGFNKVLIDPPRSGAMEVCEQIVKSECQRVVYVSCNPITLRRDVDRLIEGGFQLSKLGMIDMFPHTAHMEAIALLVRDQSNG
jgi:23S rRNA (uracil1939-C5)-methyltransferase